MAVLGRILNTADIFVTRIPSGITLKRLLYQSPIDIQKCPVVHCVFCFPVVIEHFIAFKYYTLTSPHLSTVSLCH